MNQKIKSVIIFALLIGVFWSTAREATAAAPNGPRGPLGLGIALGEPTAMSMNYWLDQRSSLHFMVGSAIDFDGQMTFVGDYLAHKFSAEGPTSLNLGLGVRARTGQDDVLAIRGIVGLSYFIPQSPFEIYVELVPVLNFIDDFYGDFEGGLGMHFYFGR